MHQYEAPPSLIGHLICAEIWGIKVSKNIPCIFVLNNVPSFASTVRGSNTGKQYEPQDALSTLLPICRTDRAQSIYPIQTITEIGNSLFKISFRHSNIVSNVVKMFTIPLIFLFRHIAFCSASPLQLRQAVTPPPECNVIPTWEVTQFRWFNSSQNLDCVHQVNVRKCGVPPAFIGAKLTTNAALVCVNSTSNGLVGCDGNIDHCASCGIPGCYTGVILYLL